MAEAKPFDIAKRDVWEAFKKVRANQGAAGVDGLRELLSSSGATGVDPEGRGRWRTAAWYSNGRGSLRPGSGQAPSGAHPGTDFP